MSESNCVWSSRGEPMPCPCCTPRALRVAWAKAQARLPRAEASRHVRAQTSCPLACVVRRNSLHTLFRTFKGLIMLNEPSLIEACLSDAFFLDTMGYPSFPPLPSSPPLPSFPPTPCTKKKSHSVLCNISVPAQQRRQKGRCGVRRQRRCLGVLGVGVW